MQLPKKVGSRSGIVIVLVFDWGVARRCDTRLSSAWRGAALARTFPPSRIRPNTNPAETCKNRRLPGIIQRFAALWPGVNDPEPQIKHCPGLFPGAARCDISQPD